MVNATPTALNIEHYGRIVERTSTLRRLIGAAGEIAALAYEDTENAGEVVDQAEQIIFGVSQQRITRDVRPIRDVIKGYLDRVDYLYQHRGETIGVPTGYLRLGQMAREREDRGEVLLLGAVPELDAGHVDLTVANDARSEAHSG